MITPPTWSLPPEIQSRLGKTSVGRQRAIAEAGHLLLVLHKLPDPSQEQRQPALFWRKPDGEWLFNGGGPGMGRLKEHVQTYMRAEAEIEKAYDSAVSARDYFQLLEQITPMTRAARNMAHALQQARELVREDTALIEARDLAGDADRSFELLHHDIKNAIDYKIAKESEEQAALTRQALQASHRLNVLAALFFPLMAISGLFGMNLQSGWEDQSLWIFWAVLGFGFLLGLTIKTWVLRPPDKNRR